MSGLSFANAWVLIAMPPLLAAAALWWRSSSTAVESARTVSRAVPGRAALVPAVLVILAVAAAILAASGPRWGERQAPVERRGADLVFVVDVSRSMAAQDVEPDRMAVARDAVINSLSRLAGDRVGVVVFGGSARLRFPLTTDLDGATQVVSSLRPGSVLVQAGTDAGSGLDLAREMLADSEGDGLVVLVTDGDDLGADPIGAAEALGGDGVSLLVLAVGTAEGATVPILDSTTGEFVPKPASDGSPLISRLDETLLANVATAAGGRYLGTASGALAGAVQSAAADLTQRRVAEATATVPVERFQWFAGAALALLVIALLVEAVPRPALIARSALLLLLPVVLVSCATRAHDLDEQGRAAYNRGDFDGAVTAFLEARAEAPADQRISLNLASALHQAGRHGEATSAARRVLLEGTDDERQLAHASLGRHWFALGDLEASLEAFKQALLLDPSDGAARHDYEVVLRLLSAGEEPPPMDPGENPPGETPGGEGPGEEDPGDGDPGPGEPGGGDGTGGSGEMPPATEDDIDRALSELDSQIAELREDAGDDVSTEEALRILDLLAERSEIAGLRDGLNGGSEPGDY